MCVRTSWIFVFNVYLPHVLPLIDFKVGCEQFWRWVYSGGSNTLTSKEPSTTVSKRTSNVAYFCVCVYAWTQVYMCLCVMCSCPEENTACVCSCVFVFMHVYSFVMCLCAHGHELMCLHFMPSQVCVHIVLMCCFAWYVYVLIYYAYVSIYHVEALPWLWLLPRLGSHLKLLNWQSIGASLVFSLILLSKQFTTALLLLKSCYFCYVIHTYYPWSYLMIPLCRSPL